VKSALDLALRPGIFVGRGHSAAVKAEHTQKEFERSDAEWKQTRRDIALAAINAEVGAAVAARGLVATEKQSPAHPSAAQPKKPRRQVSERDQRIYEVILKGLEGPAYCRALDKAKIRPPERWTRGDTCPDTYAAAYQQDKWKRPINREKSRIAARMRGSSRVVSA
jgi:hypothetical protein